MSILRELLSLHEAERATRATVDISTLFRNSNQNIQLTHDRLKFVERNGAGTWHGDRIVVGDHDNIDDGPVYEKIQKAAKEFFDDGFEIRVSQDLDVSHLAKDDAPGMIELEFTSKIDVDEANLVRIYYDPVKDRMYAGFDVWANQDDFDEAFDAAFEHATGKSFVIDDEDHYAVLDKLHKEFNEKYHIWGVVLEFKHGGSSYTVSEDLPAVAGGFVRGVQPMFLQHNKNVFGF